MLKWKLQHGANEKTVRKQAAQQGMPLPDWIINKPKLLPGLDIFWNAFHDLESDRMPMFEGMGDIPWSSMQRYCEQYGWAKDQAFFTRFVVYLKRMDNVHQEHYAEKRRAAANASKSRTKTKR